MFPEEKILWLTHGLLALYHAFIKAECDCDIFDVQCTACMKSRVHALGVFAQQYLMQNYIPYYCRGMSQTLSRYINKNGCSLTLGL